MANLIERLSSIAQNHRDAVATLAGFVEKMRLNFISEKVGQSNRGIQQTPTDVRTPAHLLPSEHQIEKERAIEKALLEDIRRRMEGIQKLTEDYEGLLYRMAFIYRVALYDAFVPDVLMAVVLTQTKLLKSSKTLTHQEIVEHTDKGTLIEFMAEKVITPFSYSSIIDQSKVDQR